jgi:hypothetical protein
MPGHAQAQARPGEWNRHVDSSTSLTRDSSTRLPCNQVAEEYISAETGANGETPRKAG